MFSHGLADLTRQHVQADLFKPHFLEDRGYPPERYIDTGVDLSMANPGYSGLPLLEGAAKAGARRTFLVDDERAARGFGGCRGFQYGADFLITDLFEINVELGQCGINLLELLDTGRCIRGLLGFCQQTLQLTGAESLDIVLYTGQLGVGQIELPGSLHSDIDTPAAPELQDVEVGISREILQGRTHAGPYQLAIGLRSGRIVATLYGLLRCHLSNKVKGFLDHLHFAFGCVQGCQIRLGLGLMLLTDRFTLSESHAVVIAANVTENPGDIFAGDIGVLTLG